MNQNTNKTHCKRGHEFTEENTYISKKQRQCLICKRAQAEKDKERTYIASRNFAMRKAGWTADRAEEVLKSQENKCAICGIEFTKENGPHMDHEHSDPPKPRGLLCGNCNRGIGCLRDNPIVCESAAAYLRVFADTRQRL